MKPTPPPLPGPPLSKKQQVWFPDTSALVTLAVHTPLQQVVQKSLSGRTTVLAEAVVRELQGLTVAPPPLGKWARTALSQLDWLHKPIRLDSPQGTDLALALQERMASGRMLRHPMEHFGEAAIIALASRARRMSPIMLSDDHDARTLARDYRVTPVSTHRLLHMLVQRRRITPDEAQRFCDALADHGRGPTITAADFLAGRLGRVGKP